MNETGTRPNKLQWYQRIGNRIVLVAIVSAVLPLLMISSTIALKVRNDLVQQTVLAQKQRAATIQHGIEMLLLSYYQQIETLARLPQVQSMNSDHQIDFARDFLEQQKIFFSCAIYSRQKSILCLAIRNRKDSIELAPEAFVDQSGEETPISAAFSRVIHTGQPAFSSYYSAAFQEKMLFVLAPVFDFVDSESVVGVISCSISFSDPGIHEIICGYPIDPEDVLTLTDKDGNLLSWQGNIPETFSALRIPVQVAESANPSAVRVAIASETYLGTIARVPGFDGYLIAAKPWNSAMAFLNQLLLDLIIVLAVALVIAVAAGFLMARSLATGIDSLVNGIREVANGVISHRVEVVGKDELAEAGNAFNEMVETLEKHRMIDEIWSREWQTSTEQKHADDEN